jgi:catechol 2,3-dioxygenase-like lactoylglutathione lyase family enzyme
MNIEVQVLPVSSVERSKEFYQRLGWRLDDDVAPTKDVRIVQFTPPGSMRGLRTSVRTSLATPYRRSFCTAMPIASCRRTLHPEDKRR